MEKEGLNKLHFHPALKWLISIARFNGNWSYLPRDPSAHLVRFSTVPLHSRSASCQPARNQTQGLAKPTAISQMRRMRYVSSLKKHICFLIEIICLVWSIGWIAEAISLDQYISISYYLIWVWDAKITRLKKTPCGLPPISAYFYISLICFPSIIGHIWILWMLFGQDHQIFVEV